MSNMSCSVPSTQFHGVFPMDSDGFMWIHISGPSNSTGLRNGGLCRRFQVAGGDLAGFGRWYSMDSWSWIHPSPYYISICSPPFKAPVPVLASHLPVLQQPSSAQLRPARASRPRAHESHTTWRSEDCRPSERAGRRVTTVTTWRETCADGTGESMEIYP